jgi:hypothetical protein
MSILKPTTIVIAAVLAILGASSLAGAASTATAPSQKAVTVIAVLGPKVNVPAGRFVKAYAYCPKGYYVTGGGAYSGAITEIASSPLPDLRGWFVDGTNTDPQKRTFQHRADAVCVKGSPAVPVGSAAKGSLTQQVERDFAARGGS